MLMQIVVRELNVENVIVLIEIFWLSLCHLSHFHSAAKCLYLLDAWQPVNKTTTTNTTNTFYGRQFLVHDDETSRNNATFRNIVH